jgi:hypothetical protein
MFPAFVTTFFVRNAYRMFDGLDAKDRAKAMAQLFGTLAMSGMLAGYAGVPGASMMMGVLQGINNALKDEDEDDPLDGRDLEFWFRNKWLPETFGSVKVGNHTLDEILDRGVLTAMTGYDITGSMSLNNMWMPEVKESATASAAMQEYLMSLLGPGASLTLKQVPKAIDYFNKGDILRGLEQHLFVGRLPLNGMNARVLLLRQVQSSRMPTNSPKANCGRRGLGLPPKGLWPSAKQSSTFKARFLKSNVSALNCLIGWNAI